jgi:hypothetical protein
MSCVNIETVVREINILLDQQLAFLSGDVSGLDPSAWQEYEGRYFQIRVLCEQLGQEAEAEESPALMVV